ncbi:MAG: hypothetical protein V1809_07550 [Planctomycetota bacterium]
MKPVTFGSAALRCVLDPAADSLRIEPAGSPAWECRLLGDLRAAGAPEDSKWEYPRRYAPGWAPGRTGIVSVEPRGPLAVELRVRTPAGPATLSVAADPDRPALRFAVEALPGTPAPMAWPGPLRPARSIGAAAAPGAQHLFAPYCQGFVFSPEPGEACEALAMQVRCGPGLGLPFVGLVAGRSGWLLTFETADDAAVEIAKPAGGPIEVHPIWLSSMGAIGYRRSLRIEFLEAADGTALAKLHRAAVKGGPTWKTLAEKASERPRVKNLAGAAYLFTGYYDFEDADRRLTELCRRLLDEAGFPGLLAGPLEMCGYRDRDISPAGAEHPLSASGTRKFLDSRGVPHTNWVLDKLADVRLENFDGGNFLMQADGSRWMSWVTATQKLAELCPLRVEAARAALFDEWCASAPAHALDTTAMTGLLECHDPGHPCTRAQDRVARAACLARFLARGHLIASEAGQDWAVPVTDVLSLNNFGHHIANSRTGWRPVPFPLFALVYRECVGSVWHEADTYHDGRGEDKILYDAALGNAPTLAPLIRLFKLVDGRPVVHGMEFFSRDETTGAGWDLCVRAADLANLHARTWQEEMVSFQYLDAERLVSRSELSRGVAILVNRSVEPVSIGGRHLPPRAYRAVR